MIHPFIEEHNTSNLQSSSENNSTIWPLSSDSFNRLKLLRIEIQPFLMYSMICGTIFLDNFECVSDQNPSLSNIPKITYLKILLWGLVLSNISGFKGALMQIWNLSIFLPSYQNSMSKISYYNTFYFLRYAHVRYMKSLFTNT